MDLLRALRPHQWIKNAFVFAALVFSRNLTNPTLGLRALVIFGAFSLVASSIYLVNDVADYERDRVHPKKRLRPIAAGLVSRRLALVVAALLGPTGLAVGFALDTSAGVVLTTYGVMNLAYSLWLKHIVLLDVFTIALGFLFRVTAGAFAIAVAVSPWLLICTFFIALFLGFCKRRNELESLGDDAAQHRGNLADYSLQFIDKMVAALASMTVMSYALYTIDPRTVAKVGTNALVLTVPLVLFGIFRYLFLVHQRGKGGSPTELVLKDRSLQTVIALYLAVSVACIYFNVQLNLA
ncbi:MAG: decaprenyl-phosphate phosphoribosyltransferase [Bradymonadia bacterium]|jgi:4-hydroxybenzoate polyprenyltransferase